MLVLNDQLIIPDIHRQLHPVGCSQCQTSRVGRTGVRHSPEFPGLRPDVQRNSSCGCPRSSSLSLPSTSTGCTSSSSICAPRGRSSPGILLPSVSTWSVLYGGRGCCSSCSSSSSGSTGRSNTRGSSGGQTGAEKCPIPDHHTVSFGAGVGPALSATLRLWRDDGRPNLISD